MDGNGRWATQRHLPRVAGHTRGLDAVRAVVEASAARGVQFLTLFAFSSENWRRPADEVSFLMRLFMMALRREVVKMHANNIRLRVVGDLDRFSPRIQRLISDAEARTAGNTGLTVTIAANYGGRWDLLQAMRKMLARSPMLDPASIDESVLRRTWRWPMRRSRISSSAPAANSASATSCCGSWRIPSCISPTFSGRISTPPNWTRPSPHTASANAVSAAPAHSWSPRDYRVRPDPGNSNLSRDRSACSSPASSPPCACCC